MKSSNRDLWQRAFSWMSWLALFYLTWVTLRIQNGWLYHESDGNWAAWTMRSSINWSKIPFEPIVANPFGGMGSLFAPNSPWMNPGALMLALPLKIEQTYHFSYIAYWLVLAVSVYVFARTLGVGRLLSSSAAQVHVFIFFPPFAGTWFWVLPSYYMEPLNAYVFAMMNFAAAIIVYVGHTRSAAGNVLLCAGLCIAAIALIASAPLTSITYIPAYGTALACIVYAKHPNAREWVWKIAAMCSVLLVCLAIGAFDYLTALTHASARFPFAASNSSPWTSNELFSSIRHMCDAYTYTLACKNSTSLPYIVASTLAAIWLSVFSENWRPLALWYLAFFTASNLYHGPSLAFFNDLPAIRSDFLIWSTYVFGTILAVVGIASMVGSIKDRITEKKFSIASNMAVLLVPVTALISVPAHVHLWPPLQPINRLATINEEAAEQGPIVQHLIANASIKPGDPFRGLTAAYISDPSPYSKQFGVSITPFSWVFSQYTRKYFFENYKNSYQETGLWRFSIPTLEDYGHAITFQMFAYMSEFLAPRPQIITGKFVKDDKVTVLRPEMLRVYTNNYALLASLGVRFLITDKLLVNRNARLILTEEKTDESAIHLYELSNPNLGTYSPTNFIPSSSFEADADALHRINDRTSTMISTLSPMQPLEPPSEVSFYVQKGGYHVSAKSASTSVLLLPIQFSNCLRSIPQNLESNARLFRANLVQTGIEFSGNLATDIVFNFGLFGEKACRLQDVADMQRFTLRNIMPSAPAH